MFSGSFCGFRTDSLTRAHDGAGGGGNVNWTRHLAEWKKDDGTIVVASIPRSSACTLKAFRGWWQWFSWFIRCRRQVPRISLIGKWELPLILISEIAKYSSSSIQLLLGPWTLCDMIAVGGWRGGKWLVDGLRRSFSKWLCHWICKGVLTDR